ncbi:MAG TPA: Spy/CpxP family protein refolding chaperone [Xanthobacteraceae bacterium]|jgi:hypothetical protein|nr:Spy/CpxP family protein refolding chaperone [Xanthobacteraceae bacterium]
MKVIAAGLAALFVTVSPLAHAQQNRPSQADLNALTDARVMIVKAALQLTPDQEKFWPAIEQAIRQRAKDRQERLQGFMSQSATTEGQAQSDFVHPLLNRTPVELMQRRAENMEQRAADLKKLADAWQPLYQTLTDDQKRRMAALAIVALRDVTSGIERRRMSDDTP